VALPLVWVAPSAPDWALLVALGVLGGAGHGLLVLAFARAPASLLSPLSYSQLVWAMLAGVVVFGDWPRPMALLGMAIIVGGGILVALPERQRAAAAGR
jgi:drug/metabolite transporter (DMT)-like permease